MIVTKNVERLPYLHKIAKRKFLVSNKNMGLCLYMQCIGCVLFSGNQGGPLINKTRGPLKYRMIVAAQPVKRTQDKNGLT